jgi:hypothetical protein
MSLDKELLGDIEDLNEHTNGKIFYDNVEKHADVMARILFIYAKLNPGVKYV